jgi:hypothetical protein
VVVRELPVMDVTLLPALVDRWRPETHSFHLPCGKMTVGMQDTTMILSVPLEGLPVSEIIQSPGWRDMVELHIGVGVRPPDADERDASKKTSGANTVWLRQHFTVCPQGAAEVVVERHTRVWLWHFVATILLPDAAGNTMSWMVLPLLGRIGTISVATVGVRRFWHGCIDNYVMPVGGVDRTRTLVDALTSCRFGFGSVFQYADHTVGLLRYIHFFCSLFMKTFNCIIFIIHSCFKLWYFFCRHEIGRTLDPHLDLCRRQRQRYVVLQGGRTSSTQTSWIFLLRHR